MNNITKALAYLFVMFFLLAVGGYTFSKQQTPNTEVKEEEKPSVVDDDSTFVNNIKEIYKYAQQTWISDSSMETDYRVYCNVEGCEKSIEEISFPYSYYIAIDSGGKVTRYYVVDGTYQFAYTGNELLLENITNGRKISELDPNEVITIAPNM